MIEFEYADLNLAWDNLTCEKPSPVKYNFPSWIKNLKGNIKEYFPAGSGQDHTARHCRGLQELSQMGLTCPLPVDVEAHNYDMIPWGGLNFHPYAMHGTMWDKIADGCKADEHLTSYEWNLKLLIWPWRIKTSKNIGIMITNHGLTWQDNWFCFSGVMPPDVAEEPNRQNHFSSTIDPKFNYFQLEVVVAIKKGTFIPKDTCIFTILPFDIELADSVNDLP
jgi:hypothetical protein